MPLTIPNCVFSDKYNNKIGEKQLAPPSNYFHSRFPGSKFLLPTIISGGKLGFQVANLLLPTVNFEP